MFFLGFPRAFLAVNKTISIRFSFLEFTKNLKTWIISLVFKKFLYLHVTSLYVFKFLLGKKYKLLDKNH